MHAAKLSGNAQLYAPASRNQLAAAATRGDAELRPTVTNAAKRMFEHQRH